MFENVVIATKGPQEVTQQWDDGEKEKSNLILTGLISLYLTGQFNDLRIYLHSNFLSAKRVFYFQRIRKLLNLRRI